MEKLSVKYKIITGGMNGDVLYACHMSDDSIWYCDMNGENWIKKEMSPEELTIKFNNQ